MGKGEIARYEQFLLFPQCFQKACLPGESKGVIVWESVEVSIGLTPIFRNHYTQGLIASVLKLKTKWSTLRNLNFEEFYLMTREDNSASLRPHVLRSCTLPTELGARRNARHNSADSIPTSNLVCNKEVAIRTTFSHMINIAEIIDYTCSLVIDIQRARKKKKDVFNDLCVEITLLRSLKNSNRGM